MLCPNVVELKLCAVEVYRCVKTDGLLGSEIEGEDLSVDIAVDKRYINVLLKELKHSVDGFR